MNWKPLFAGLLAAGLLSGCASNVNAPATLPAVDPQPVVETSVPTSVTVNSAQELAAAIAPGATITLGEGVLKLDFGDDINTGNPYCWWEAVEDGFQLVISGVQDLTIQGTGRDATRIQTDPRFADVLKFENCGNLTLQGFTAGHTEQAEGCEGDVIDLGDCQNVLLEDLGIFGCGNIGINANQCQELDIRTCDIYTCSNTGINLNEVKDCKVTGSTIRDLGRPQAAAFTAISAYGGEDLVVEDTKLTGINAYNLLTLYQDARFSGCTFQNNTLSDVALALNSSENAEFATVTLENCQGSNNNAWDWTRTGAGCMVVDGMGLDLGDNAMEELFGTLSSAVAEPTAPQETVVVTTVDEFLAAIGPNKDIVIDAQELDLSTASHYGENGASDYYSWYDPYDGPQLDIINVDNLTIRGKDGKGANLISAVPRYAQVLSFQSCTNVTVKDLTLGHTKEPGTCLGGVLEFYYCGNVTVSGTGLFGCGTIGVQADSCRNMQITDNEIYECSMGGIRLLSSREVNMNSNNFHDLGTKMYGFIYDVSDDCDNITFNGTPVAHGDFVSTLEATN